MTHASCPTLAPAASRRRSKPWRSPIGARDRYVGRLVATVLITGGAGFIGANAVRALLARGDRVRIIDDLSEGEAGYLADVEGEVEASWSDVRDLEALRRSARGADHIVHLAAQSGVPPSVRDPARDFEINVRGTFNVLEAARLESVPRVVFASSGAVLAGAEPPLSEDMVPFPASPYGSSKLFGEAALRAWEGTFGVVGTAFRFANVYGPWSSHKLSVIAVLLRAALRGEPFGLEGTGEQTRDFVYVDDIVAALVSGMQARQGGLYHLATGIETSVNQLVDLAADILGTPPAIEHRPGRPGDPLRNFADNSRARAELGWKPEVSVRDGMAATADWLARTLEAES